MFKKIDKQKIQQKKYWLKHDVLDIKHVVIFIGGMLAIIWVISAINAMQKNYELQKKIDAKLYQVKILELENINLEYEQIYYKSDEYKELVARNSLNLVKPGENVLILPKYSKWVDDKKKEFEAYDKIEIKEPSNFRKWVNFLFGSNRKREVE